MGIAHLTLDLREAFRAGVVEPFLAGHAAGETPNPCVRCNGHVRLDAMLDLAERLGAHDLATGHYARVVDDGEGPLLRAAADPAKDQTYMLAALSADSLARMRFPLGDLHKPAVRALAPEAGLPVAARPDSQDLCFLAGTDRAAFLRRHGGLLDEPGEIVDAAGRVLGRHRGHHGFTVGQRRGLGRGGGRAAVRAAHRAGRQPGRRGHARRARHRPRRGARRDAASRRRPGGSGQAPLPLPAARRAPRRGRERGRHRRLELELAEPVEGAAPGQTACLMDGDVVLGWGTIAAA